MFWEGVVDRIKTRLGRWKGRFISMAERICLIKSVISVIPLFYLSMFEDCEIAKGLPVGLGSEGRKIVWASWEKVCESGDAGGLGVINIKLFNVALLGKWIWRIGSSKGGLWKKVLESKYGGWRSLKVSNPNRFDPFGRKI